MSQRITIEIKDKIATCLTELPIVCGNADYVVDFVFDEEWNTHEVKTAVFVVNGKAIDQVFAGNVCPIPVIQNTLITWVGVFAGTVNDGTLSTSTPALVKCVPCITDGDKIPLPPPEDVYNQIIEMINSGMVRGPQGEKGEKGEKGDAGAVKFVPVTELPTENIEEDAIYLVPVTDGDEENRFTEYAYVDGKWEMLGAISIQVDHSEYVKFTDYATSKKAGLVKVSANYGVSVSPDGSLATNPANETELEEQSNAYKPITPKRLSKAWKVGAIANNEEWTEEEKASACETIGALKQVNGKTTYSKVYGKDSQGNQQMYDLHGNANANSIALRRTGGTIDVGTPTADAHATTKKYVDDLIANLQAQIDALKGV